MRDLLLIAIFLAASPVCLVNPYFGVLMWTWIAYFNPHRFAFGPAYHFPAAIVVAIPTLIGTLFARNINRSFLTRETLLLFVLWIWFGFTFIHATFVPIFQGHIADSQNELIRVSKILLMTIIVILLVTTRERLKLLLLVTAFSFGLLAIKGALFGVRTDGESRVWGPPDSFLADNNAFGLALNMSLPMLFFLAGIEENRVLKRVMNVAFVCAIFCVILTYSRGGLLGLAAALGLIALKSRHRVVGGGLLFAGIFLVLTFAPAAWMARMGAFMHGDLDGSANQRLVAWRTTWNFVQDYPMMGGGFQTLPDVVIFQRYQSQPLPGGFLSTGPHSIYFQTLEEQGFVGLGLYVMLATSCWASMVTLRRRASRVPALNWMVPYTHMVEVSIATFMVSGAFLGLADFDLYFQVVAVAVVLKLLYRREARGWVASQQEAPSTPSLVEEVAT
jgi:probable O-glycosylation ligase (exosortase A-associated)